MSDNSISRECLVHYNNQHIQVRRDFFDLCAYDKNDFNKEVTRSGKKVKDEPNQECMAKILRLMETLTNARKNAWYLKNEDRIAKGLPPLKEPAEYRIELAYSTIVRLLYGTYGESTIRNSVAVLIHRAYVKRYQATTGSTPEYVLNISLLQVHLQQQAEGAGEEGLSNSTPSEEDESETDTLSNSTAPADDIDTPRYRNQHRGGVNSTPNNITNKKGDKKISEKEIASECNEDASLTIFHQLAKQEKHEEAVIFYLEKKRELTFSELEKLLSPYIEVTGIYNYHIPGNPQAIQWCGMSEKIAQLVQTIARYKHVSLDVSLRHMKKYEGNARKPNYPVSTNKDSETEHWLPTVIRAASH